MNLAGAARGENIMGIFVSVGKIIESVAVSAVFTALYCACAYKLLGILQTGGYSGKKLMGWVNKKNNLIFTRHTLLFMLCALSCAVLALCFSVAGDYAALIGTAGYAVFFGLYIWADRKVALKSPVAPTARFKRLYALFVVLALVAVYIAVTLLNYADSAWGNVIFNRLRYCPLSLFPLLLIPLVLLANLIGKAYEVPHNKKFVRKAKEKFAKSDLKVIGITGSYGKTGVKHILAALLSSKYRVLSTPRSHNTPMGLALTINNSELENYDYFIAEMGARHPGDIAELCEICPPDYSVITGICPQHLESFGSLENIVKAKGEILTHTLKSAFIADDCFDLFAAYDCKKTRQSCMKDLKCSAEGCDFTLSLGGQERKVHTKLLGRHSAENIALAAQVAFGLGVSIDDIAGAIASLDYVEHRLQLIKSGGVNILDDGYNSNIRGAERALEVLGYFGGKKIVVTPGLVELGILEESENFELGKKLVGFDCVILVGDTLVAPVRKGYIEAGGDPEKIVTLLTLEKAKDKLKQELCTGATVLFLNDLPETY